MTPTRKQIVIAVVLVALIVLFIFTRTKKSNFEDVPTSDTSPTGTTFRTYQTAAKAVYDYFEQYRLAPGGTVTNSVYSGGTPIAGYNPRTGKCDTTVATCVAIEAERTKDLSNVISWYVATRATGIYDSSPINCPRDPTAPSDAPSVKGLRVTMPAAPTTSSGQTASATVKPYTIAFVPPPTTPASCEGVTTAAQAYVTYTGL